MSKQQEQIGIDCIFSGASIKKNGDFQLSLEAPETEVANCTKLLLLRNQDISLLLVVEDGAKLPRIKMMLREVKFDANGAGRISFIAGGEDIDIRIPSFSVLKEKQLKLYFRLKI